MLRKLIKMQNDYHHQILPFFFFEREKEIISWGVGGTGLSR